MSIFFISDLHLGHANAVNFRDEFSCVEEMDQTILDNWNSVVNKHDTVFVLGDVAWNYGALAMLDGLKGKKKLVLGNHDLMEPEAYREYFTHIYGAYEWKHKVMLTHIPVHPMNMDRFRYNIHGHTHSSIVTSYTLDEDNNIVLGHDGLKDGRYINVCCEQTNYTPISYDELKSTYDFGK